MATKTSAHPERTRLRNAFVLLATCLAAASPMLVGCGDTRAADDDSPATQTSAFTYGTIGIDNGDNPTQCVFNGVGMHCCPGTQNSPLVPSVMVGIVVTANFFECASGFLSGIGPLGPPFVDGTDGATFTSRGGMHACPLGSIMVGFNKDRNDLLCRSMGRPVTSEVVKGPCCRPSSGLVLVENPNECPRTNPLPSFYSGSAMAGIHVDKQLILCDQ